MKDKCEDVVNIPNSIMIIKLPWWKRLFLKKIRIKFINKLTTPANICTCKYKKFSMYESKTGKLIEEWIEGRCDDTDCSMHGKKL